jgi:WD40 repeat protein
MKSQFTTALAVVCCLLLPTACNTTPSAAVSAPLAVSPQPAPASQPFLRIETGMHTAMITRIAVDKEERFLVTASLDKTARVWDLKNGKLLQVLRPPIGEGDEGKLYAVAMSPDGKEVALGGFTGKDDGLGNFYIYFFDTATWHLKRQIGKLGIVAIDHLVYSSDGKYLAVALWGANGIRVYSTANLQEVFRDSDYGSDSYGLDFANDGRLVSSSYDGFIRLYDARFKLPPKKAPAPGGKEPFAVRFSPDGKKIAVGFNDSSKVAVLSGDDLSFSYAPDTQGIDNGNLGKVAWSQDGNSLYAGGLYDDGTGLSPVISWSQAGRGQRYNVPLSKTGIMDLIPLQNQFVAYGASDPAWGVIDSTGQKRLENGSALNDFRVGISKHINTSSERLEFKRRNPNNPNQKEIISFDLAQQTFSKQNQAVLSAPITQAKGLEITDWFNNTHPKLNGKPLALQSYERSRALAISQDEQHFLLGTEWQLRYYDKQGQEQWQTPTPEVAWAVNLSTDGRFAIAAFGDGTIRWYSISDGQEKLAFFPHKNGKDWVLWTPEGFYSASPDAENLIGYHLNQTDEQGKLKEGQFVAVKQLSKQFYRPDLIAQRIKGDETAIRQALADIGDVREVLAKGAPPQLELISQQQEGDKVVLKFRRTNNVLVGKISYRLNGVEQETRQVFAGFQGIEPLEMTVPLTQGRNVVEVIATNKNSGIPSEPITSKPIDIQLDNSDKPELYVLAIGVSDYQQRQLKLKFADKDALAVAKSFADGGKKLFSAQHIYTLTNAQATLAEILNSFKKLSEQVKKEDVLIVYLAGHGMILNGQYHYIPVNAMYTSEDAMKTASLGEDQLSQLLPLIKSTKSVIILDTCHAAKANKIILSALNTEELTRGGLDELTAITRLKKGTGRAVLAAASGKDLALEGYKEHGYFSYALLEGMQGKADSNNDKQINVLELGTFLENRVRDLTKDRQIPVIEKTVDWNTYPIGTTP